MEKFITLKQAFIASLLLSIVIVFIEYQENDMRRSNIDKFRVIEGEIFSLDCKRKIVVNILGWDDGKIYKYYTDRKCFEYDLFPIGKRTTKAFYGDYETMKVYSMPENIDHNIENDIYKYLSLVITITGICTATYALLLYLKNKFEEKDRES